MRMPIQSFAGRLTRRILLLWILVMTVIAAVIFIKAESGMSGMSDNHYSDVLDLTNEKVQDILRVVEVSAVNVRDGRLFFCIGDVSGKGVPSALVMSIISTQFRSLSSTEDKPEKIVSVINASSKDRNATMMFATLFVGILDPDTGVLSYCNAGHNAPVLIGKERCFLKVESNLPVGVETEWKYKGQQLTLAPGKTLLLYTDGLTEAENGNHDQFGERRILDVLEKTGAADPETLVRELADAVHAFTEPAEQSDDLTMLAIRFLGKRS